MILSLNPLPVLGRAEEFWDLPQQFYHQIRKKTYLYKIPGTAVDVKWASPIIVDLGKKKQKNRYFLGIFYSTF